MMSATIHPARHYPYLDGWRGIAISLVLLEHFASVPAVGRVGVDTFFALSGLLMSKVLFEDAVPLGTFYRNRVARIFPVFYLYLLVLALGAWAWLPSVDWASLAGSALYMRTYWPAHHMWTDVLPIGNLWSLNVEEHSYVLLSLLSLLALAKHERAARWLLTAVPVLCLGAYAVYRLVPDAPDATPHDLRTECAALPLMLSAALFLWRRALRLRFSASSAVLVLLATVTAVLVDVLVPMPHFGNLFKHVLVPILLALSVNLLSDAPPAVQRALSNPLLTWLGVCSFSIYIWHYPFFHLADRWHMGHLAGLTAALAISAASFYLYEQPMRQWIRRMGTTRRPVQPQALAQPRWPLA